MRTTIQKAYGFSPFITAQWPDIGLNHLYFFPADPVNGNRFEATGREVLLAYNSGIVDRTIDIDSSPNERQRLGDVDGYVLGPGKYAVFGGPFPRDGWMQRGINYIHMSASHADVRFAVLEIPQEDWRMQLLFLDRATLRLPYSLSFAGLPNGPIPGWLGTCVVSGGAASVVPTAGAELLTNGNMETGDPPTGWGALNGTLDGVADERPGGAGAQCLGVLRNGNNLPAARKAATTTTGAWYALSAWMRNVDSSNGVQLIIQDGGGTYPSSGAFITGASWAPATITGRAISNSTYARLQVGAYGADGTSGRFDDVTFSPLLLPSLFSGPALRLGRADVRVRAAWSGTAGTQWGVAIVDSLINPTCGLCAYHDGVNAHLDKFTTALTWVPLINAAADYGAGRVVEIRRSGTTVQLWYNNVQVGADQTVSDGNILAARQSSIFGTYSANTLSTFNVDPV
jgi:hypothetical protein